MAHAFDEEIIFAVAALRRGEIVAYPTETFYGLGVDALDELALARLRALKGRDEQGDLGARRRARDARQHLPSGRRRSRVTLMQRYWPGALTIALPAREQPSGGAGHRRMRRRPAVAASDGAGAGGGAGRPAHRDQRQPRGGAARHDRRGRGGDVRGTVPHRARRAPRRAARPARWCVCVDPGWRFCAAARSKLIPTRSRVIRVRGDHGGHMLLSPDFVTPPTASAISRAFCARRTTSSAMTQRGQLEARHPENVVRLELPRGADDTRYATAARLLASWTAEGILRPDAREAFYVYEQQFGYGGTALHAARVLRGRAPRAVRASRRVAAREDAVRAQGGSPAPAARDAHADLARVRAVPGRRAGRRAPSSTRRHRPRPRSTRRPPTAFAIACGRSPRPAALDGLRLLLRRQADPDRRRAPPLRDDARAGARDAAAGRRRRARRRRTSR